MSVVEEIEKAMVEENYYKLLAEDKEKFGMIKFVSPFITLSFIDSPYNSKSFFFNIFDFGLYYSDSKIKKENVLKYYNSSNNKLVLKKLTYRKNGYVAYLNSYVYDDGNIVKKNISYDALLNEVFKKIDYLFPGSITVNLTNIKNEKYIKYYLLSLYANEGHVAFSKIIDSIRKRKSDVVFLNIKKILPQLLLLNNKFEPENFTRLYEGKDIIVMFPENDNDSLGVNLLGQIIKSDYSVMPDMMFDRFLVKGIKKNIFDRIYPQHVIMKLLDSSFKKVTINKKFL